MSVSREDENFWLDAVKDVEISKKDNQIFSEHKIDIEIKHDRQYAVKMDFSTYSKALDNFAGGIDNASLKRFKKEDFAVEAVLDLHGLTEDKAFEAVDSFVVRSYNQGKRCIIIITGKGLSTRDDDIFASKGVLRKQVPQWLEMPRLRSMILIYKNPSEKLGGKGALYILLRRNKNLF